MERGWNAHVLGEAPHKFKDAATALATLRVRSHLPHTPCRALPYALPHTHRRRISCTLQRPLLLETRNFL